MFSFKDTGLNELVLTYCTLKQVEMWWRSENGEHDNLIMDDMGISRYVLDGAIRKVQGITQDQDSWWFGLPKRSFNSIRSYTDIDSKSKLSNAITNNLLSFEKGQVLYKGDVMHGAGKGAFTDYAKHCGVKVNTHTPISDKAISAAISLLEKNGYVVEKTQG